MEIKPSLSEFLKLARQGNVIPVCGERLADLETPVTAFMKLDNGRMSFLLESVEGTEKVARFSFLGSRPRILFTSVGRHVELSEFKEGRGPKVRRWETTRDPIAEIESFMRQFRFVPVSGLPRFCGGLVGFFSYNVVRFLERLPAHKTDDLHVPDIMLMLADRMVIFDHAQHKLLFVVNTHIKGSHAASAYRQAVSEIRAMAAQLRKPIPAPKPGKTGKNPEARSNMSRAQFESMVSRAKTHIRNGDIIQVVLSQRWERPLRAKPLDVYRVLRSINPSPYMFLLRFDALCLVGASPEMLVRCEDGLLETRPIAGTRRRGANEREDQKLIDQLRGSPKERAEHLMLVDLGRNDLGRVAESGSVKTPELMIVEKYSHVLHLVSSVTGKLKRGKTAFDVLRAAFPAGTVTGAPKVRAMEIIATLERNNRATYAGAVGYIGFSGNLDTCITIRTLLIQNNRAYVQAGAGIVADSNPAREYQESINKARGTLAAIELAEQKFVRKR